MLKAFGRANKYLSLIFVSMALGLAFTFTGLIGTGMAGAADTPTLVLDDYQYSYPLGCYLDIFEDKTTKLGINEVSSPQQDRFVPLNGQDRNPDFSRPAIWLRAIVWRFNRDKCLPLAVRLPHDLRHSTTINAPLVNFTPITLKLSVLISESLLA